MRLLFIGDVVGSSGCRFAKSAVYELRKKENIDIVIVNGENSADGNGITPSSADMLLSFADVITTGNHCFRRKEMLDLFDRADNIIRPANYPVDSPGKGVCVIDKGSAQTAVVNLQGMAYMTNHADNPFNMIDDILDDLKTKLNAPNIILDFHAEATSEKKAMGVYLNGKVTAVIGTHTHVQTADETILTGSTAYITDVGMCGAETSVLGVRSDVIIKRLKTGLPERFSESDMPCFLNGVIIDYNEKSGKSAAIRRIIIR